MTGTARDRLAEIDLSIRHAVGGNPDVVVLAEGADAGTAGALRLRGVRGMTVDGGTSADPGVPVDGSTPGSGRAGGWLSFTGAHGQLSVDPADASVLRVGLGDVVDAENVRDAAALALRGAPTGSDVVLEPLGDPDLEHAWVDGAVTGLPAGVVLRVPAAGAGGIVSAQATALAKSFTDAPANIVDPASAADICSRIADLAGLGIEIVEPDGLAALGCGAILAVGQGSVNGPRLVHLTYRPERATGGKVALVGKGITFDSGGLSLKPPAGMMGMRYDKAAAGAILATMAVLPRLAPEIAVDAWLPFAENLPGPGAVRPGDVVRAANGVEIQIMDTDFEGRLILADALALAARDEPDLIVDLATLTYQVVVGLGDEIAGAIGRDEVATERLLAAGTAAGEAWWPLPYARRYAAQMQTPSGMRNHPMHDSGRAITAALFLGAFVPEHIPWVHGDIAGPGWKGNASVDGATGFGVRTLLELLL
ncbi:leucyl aminopeptidase [Nakamurella sp. YIM 132087]|uniref:Probable cytosol aminopeptidase n=1 Tax=Nakamurella alba TaxID=2665158 RepID=A0A7K1FM61_9ACTN|nr:leucyl aminopeptidase family protein [Nakamurella alba]MTD15242.1 leucyl aminopeptidase [Nakamurella alba]